MSGTRRVSLLVVVAMVGGMVAAAFPALPASAVTITGITEDLISGASSPFGLAVVAADSSFIYWGNAGTDTIGRANLDGTSPNENFINARVNTNGNQEATNGVAVRGGLIYWSNQFTGTIGRATLNGPGAATNQDNAFITGGNQTTRVVVTANFIYWANNGNDTIGRASLDGSGNLVPGTVNQSFINLATSPVGGPFGDGPVGLAVDANYIYWANQNSSSIGRSNLDGTGVNNVFITTGVSSPAGVAIDSAHIFWANYPLNTVSVANLADGSNVQVLVSDANSPRGVTRDGNYLYWANNGNGTIGRAQIVNVPGAPTIGTATAGNGSGSVTYTGPADNGGSSVTSYTVTCTSPTGTSPVSAPPSLSNPILVSGLTNGATYTCTVAATNAVGTGPPSAPSNSFVPATVPGAPTIGTATAGNGSGSVTFTPPTDNGGSGVTGYTATCTSTNMGATGSASGPGSPLLVSGLTNGKTYTCTVTATNAIGSGAPSAPSNTFVPATVPSPPTIGAVASGGVGAASVSFTPGANGGSAITSFTATCVSLIGQVSGSAAGTGSPIIVPGLASQTPYSCFVTATNSVGTSGPSGSSSVVFPASLPDAGSGGGSSGGCTVAPTAPRNPSASAQAFPGAVVSWAAPLSGCVAGYIVTPYLNGVAQPPTLVPGRGTTTVIKGLTVGGTYTFTVAAENGVVAGPASAMTAAVTIGVPTAVSAVSVTKAGRGSVKVSFAAARSNGAPIKSYTATCSSSNGGKTRSMAGKASPLTVTGLTVGVAYTCAVTATNSRGTGPASARSAIKM